MLYKIKSFVLFTFFFISSCFCSNLYGLSLDQLKSISKTFSRSYKIKLSDYILKSDVKIKHVVYGHHAIGFFSSNNYQLSSDKKFITINYIPVSYKFPISFKIIDHKNQTHHISNKIHKSFVPEIFKKVKIKVTSGNLQNNFYLLNAALPRQVLSDYNFESKDPKFFRKNHHRFTYLMIINRFSEIVWLHIPVVGSGLSSSYISSKSVGNGFYGIMFGKQAGHFEVVKHDGSIFREFSSKDVDKPFVMHHDFETIGADKLYAVGNEPLNMYKYTKNPIHKKKTFITDTIIGIDLVKQRSKKLIGFMRYFDPKNTPFETGDAHDDKKFVIWGSPKADIDFLHINAVDYVAEKEAVLVSFRNISKLGLVDKNFKKLLWTLGSQRTDDFYISSKADQFNHQHTPFFTGKDTIMLFDNSIVNKKSRVVEYRLDKKSNKAQLIWQFSPNPEVFSKDRSSVYKINDKIIGVFFVNPKYPSQKLSVIPHRDYYYEIDISSKKQLAKVVITYPVATPGYRMIPLDTINNDEVFDSAKNIIDISLKKY